MLVLLKGIRTDVQNKSEQSSLLYFGRYLDYTFYIKRLGVIGYINSK